MNNLKCRKKGFNKIICRRTNKEITLDNCKNCPCKEYKDIQYNIENGKKNVKICKKAPVNVKKSPKKVEIRKKTNKLAKLERDRESLFTDDLDHCIICGRKKEHIHEVFYGRNRKNSMIYKLCVPLCCDCHRKMHSDTNLQEQYHKKGQALFNETYPELDFLDIFKENFLDK